MEGSLENLESQGQNIRKNKSFKTFRETKEGVKESEKDQEKMKVREATLLEHIKNYRNIPRTVPFIRLRK